MSENNHNMLEDTDRIQKAIEDVIDQETNSIPILPVLEPEPKADEGLPEADKPDDDEEWDRPATGIRSWFFTFMCMNIPIVGWIYLMYLAFNKRQTERRYFARAYLFYKLLFLLISLIILGIVLFFGLQLLDQVLAYMEML